MSLRPKPRKKFELSSLGSEAEGCHLAARETLSTRGAGPNYLLSHPNVLTPESYLPSPGCATSSPKHLRWRSALPHIYKYTCIYIYVYIYMHKDILIYRCTYVYRFRPRSRANLEHMSQSTPDSGRGWGRFQYERPSRLLSCSLVARQRVIVWGFGFRVWGCCLDSDSGFGGVAWIQDFAVVEIRVWGIGCRV